MKGEIRNKGSAPLEKRATGEKVVREGGEEDEARVPWEKGVDGRGGVWWRKFSIKLHKNGG